MGNPVRMSPSPIPEPRASPHEYPIADTPPQTPTPSRGVSNPIHFCPDAEALDEDFEGDLADADAAADGAEFCSCDDSFCLVCGCCGICACWDM